MLSQENHTTLRVQRVRRSVAALAAAAVAATGLAFAPGGATAVAPSLPVGPADGKIVFWYDVPDDGTDSSDLVTINPDGSGLTVVVDSSPSGPIDGVGHPAWSPDGRRIVFVGYSNVRQDHSVFVVNANGTGLTELTYLDSSNVTQYMGDTWNVSWAPDGRIWLGGNHDLGPSDLPIYVYDPTVRTLRGFAAPTDCGDYCANPTVSPDGTKVAWSDWTDVWVAPVNNLAAAVKVMRGNSHVTWTPDGRVAAREDNADGGVVVAAPTAGATPVKLNETGLSPAFAPSGLSLIYLTKVGSGSSSVNTLWGAAANGSNPVNLSAAWGLTGRLGAMNWLALRSPSKPARPTVEAGRGKATVKWTAPTSMSPITRYQAQAFTRASGGSAVKSCSTNERRCTITGLKTGTKFWISVSATSAVGQGPASARQGVTVK
jgi:hypothetical protein